MYSCEEVLVALHLQIGHVIMEFAGKSENHAKANPDSESGTK
jgi:hypothetical protein